MCNKGGGFGSENASWMVIESVEETSKLVPRGELAGSEDEDETVSGGCGNGILRWLNVLAFFGIGT